MKGVAGRGKFAWICLSLIQSSERGRMRAVGGRGKMAGMGHYTRKREPEMPASA